MDTLADPARPWMGPAAGVPKAMKNSKISAFSSLPAPLTEGCVDQFLTELAPGSKKAVQSCLECWKVCCPFLPSLFSATRAPPRRLHSWQQRAICLAS